MRLISAPYLALSLALSAGCQQQEPPETPIGKSARYELTEAEAAPPEESEEEEIAEDVVYESARPFTGYRLNDERTFDQDTFLTLLASADLICVGERHDDPLDHYAQLAILQGILERAPMRGAEIGVAFEMVRADYQSTLDSYVKGAIQEEEFLTRVAWNKTWGFSPNYYRPLFDEAADAEIEGLALGVRREITRDIAEHGLEKASAEHKKMLGELDLKNPRHQNRFYALLQAAQPKGGQAHGAGHAHSSGSSLSAEASFWAYYAAQVVWDESMAERAAAWLSKRAPARKLIVFAGAAHCAYSAIVQRAERRADIIGVSVLPVEGGKPLKARRAPPLPQELTAAAPQAARVEPEEDSSGAPTDPNSSSKKGDSQQGGQSADDTREILAGDYDYQLIFQ